MENKDKNITRSKITAVIFDMDGVISDTQVIHAKTESELLKGYGIEIHPDEITRRYAGVVDAVMFEEIFNKAHQKTPQLKQLLERKWKIMDDLIKGGVKEISGTREFITRLEERGLRLGVASASRIEFINQVLSALVIA